MSSSSTTGEPRNRTGLVCPYRRRARHTALLGGLLTRFLA